MSALYEVGATESGSVLESAQEGRVGESNRLSE